MSLIAQINTLSTSIGTEIKAAWAAINGKEPSILKNTVALATLNVDWNAGARFTKTISGNETWTFSNLQYGMRILEITGDFAITLPTGFEYSGGERAASGMWTIQVFCTNTATPTGRWIILKNET